MDIQSQEVDKLEQELCCMQTRLREETATEEGVCGVLGWE